MNSWLARWGKRLRTPLALRVGVVVAAVLGLAFVLVRFAAPHTRAIDFTELSELAKGDNAERVHVDGVHFAVESKNGDELTSVVDDPEARHALVEHFAANRVPLDFGAREPGGVGHVLTIAAPIATLLAFGAAFLVFQRRRSRAHFAAFQTTGTSDVRFSDVAGMDEVKDALSETVEFLHDPARFGRLGGRAPRGVLLTGAPGTGKTLLARAVATEAAVPFLSASGSSFQEMFVGVGASRVRSLFAEARRVAPCIVFIDEIDAVGRSRSRAGDSATADHDQTLNQLLVEMDGFDHTTGIVVIASTNRPDVLDSALLRPGRFDRQVVVPLPDLRGRLEILNVHARPIELDTEVDLARVARGTPGFSGAELANLLNEAAIVATRSGADVVTSVHIDRARDRVLMGAERKGMMLDPEERYATAVHEAGHVATGVALEHTDPVHKVSILPRGRALGVTHSLPERDRLMLKREFLRDQICMLLGGRAAEIELLDTMTAGAADDIERATNLARKMVAELGMSDIGPISVKESYVPHSQALLDRVEETTRALLEGELSRARQIVRTHREEIGVLVGALLENDTLNADAIRACFPNAARWSTHAPASIPKLTG